MRSMKFNNELSHSLYNVLDRLYETIRQLTKDMVIHNSLQTLYWQTKKTAHSLRVSRFFVVYFSTVPF